MQVKQNRETCRKYLLYSPSQYLLITTNNAVHFMACLRYTQMGKVCNNTQITDVYVQDIYGSNLSLKEINI